MNEIARARLFGFRNCFDEPVIVPMLFFLGALLVVAPVVTFLLTRMGKLRPELTKELFHRYLSWLVIVPCLVVPILAGAAWTILMIVVLSIACYRDFARTTGCFREKRMSLMVVLGILALNFAALDNWYYFFVALTPLVVSAMAFVALVSDQPKGYLQRVGMAVLSFLLFGLCLGHLSYLTTDTHFRSILVLLLISVEMNDVFADCVGKWLGGRRLLPQTSPSQTISGAVAALILTAALVYFLAGYVFPSPPLSHPIHRIVLGLLISAGGQVGDLMMASVKRDAGIQDTGVVLPGHVGLLDRFNSLLISAPALFHYVEYFSGVGADQPTRIFTGITGFTG